tara:strand:- start:1340 stop:1546 length:207 start_codon:yes stop_codon:yes gene_type:complete
MIVVSKKRKRIMPQVKKPFLKWHEKLQLYFAGMILLGFIAVSSDINQQREKEEKIQECVQFLEDNQIE